MALLGNHLEQISLSAAAISDLPFPPPKIFANALLQPHDITALIRDVELHERALFSLDPAARPAQRRATRRGTLYPTEDHAESLAQRILSARDRRGQSTVTRVLGGNMVEEIKRSTSSSTGRNPRGEINLELLLQGAEKLCTVYPVAGAMQKIAHLRDRHAQVSDSVAMLEVRVAKQGAQLERMNYSHYADEDENPVEEMPVEDVPEVTDEDIERELEEIRELERRKRTLEDRVNGMDRDLGGLMR